MSTIKTIIIAAAMTAASFTAISTLNVAVHAETVASYAVEGEFVRKSKRLKGGWEVVERDGKTFIVFHDDFRAAGGPDLKVFLSPQSVAAATGKTATKGAINLGELAKTKGVQEYEVPAGIDLADYGSVLVHCEAYSVLWGGGDL